MYQKADKPVDVYNYVDNKVDMHKFRGSYFDRCVLWVRMDEMKGSETKDWSFYSDRGTIFGATWFVDGKFHHCLDFDGTDDYVNVHSTKLDSDLAGTNVFSIEAWVKYDELHLYQSVIVAKDAAFTRVGFDLWINNEVAQPQQKSLEFYFTNNGAGGVDANRAFYHSSGKLSNAGQWYHVAVAIDVNQSGVDKVRFYIDGVLQQTIWRKGNNALTSIYQNADDLRIGEAERHGSNFNGRIDEVRIYRRILASDEVRKRWEIGRQPPL